MIDAAINLYDADKVGSKDYALRSQGAAVYFHSPTYTGEWSWRDAVLAVFGTKPLRQANLILSDDMNLGQCWPMNGTMGFATIHLSAPIVVKSVTIEHVSNRIAHHTNTAPRKIVVYGVGKKGETDSSVITSIRRHTPQSPSGDFLGEYEYDINGKTAWQTFPMAVGNEQTYRFVTIGVLSNYGNPHLTCIYRVRVHGNEVSDAAQSKK